MKGMKDMKREFSRLSNQVIGCSIEVHLKIHHEGHEEHEEGV